MSRAFLPLTCILALAGLPVSVQAREAGFDTSWQQAGHAWTFLGVEQPGGFARGFAPDPDAWFSDHATVLGVSPTQITIQFEACASLTAATPSSVATVTYVRQTRLDATEQASFLWINPSDVAMGHAQLGDHEYVLLMANSPLVEFSDGHTDYWFDAHTGLLHHVTDEWNGAASTRTPGPSACPNASMEHA